MFFSPKVWEILHMICDVVFISCSVDFILNLETEFDEWQLIEWDWMLKRCQVSQLALAYGYPQPLFILFLWWKEHAPHVLSFGEDFTNWHATGKPSELTVLSSMYPVLLIIMTLYTLCLWIHIDNRFTAFFKTKPWHCHWRTCCTKHVWEGDFL